MFNPFRWLLELHGVTPNLQDKIRQDLEVERKKFHDSVEAAREAMSRAVANLNHTVAGVEAEIGALREERADHITLNTSALMQGVAEAAERFGAGLRADVALAKDEVQKLEELVARLSLRLVALEKKAGIGIGAVTPRLPPVPPESGA